MKTNTIQQAEALTKNTIGTITVSEEALRYLAVRLLDGVDAGTVDNDLQDVFNCLLDAVEAYNGGAR